jgi:hypothetical protein
MAMTSIEVRPPNSLLVVTGPRAVRVPEPDGVTPVVASSDTVLILTRYEHDGPTRVTLDASGSQFWPPEGLQAVFDGVLSVLDNQVLVQNVYMETYLAAPVQSGSVRIRIAIDQVVEPRDVWIQIG